MIMNISMATVTRAEIIGPPGGAPGIMWTMFDVSFVYLFILLLLPRACTYLTDFTLMYPQNYTPDDIQNSIATNLTDILNKGINLDVNPDMSFSFLGKSDYFDDKEFYKYLHGCSQRFIVLSSNIRGIRSKYDDLILRLNDFNSSGSTIAAITLQETQLLEGGGISHIDIPGYTCVYAYGTASTKGGVATYIRNDLNFEITKLPNYSSNIWEAIFVNVSGDSLGGKKFTVGNIYRPPRERVELLDKFIMEFLNILDFFNNSQNVMIGGDFNLNLLSISEENRVHNFLLQMFTYDFYPKILHPTRLSRFGGTLIDNFFCKAPDFSCFDAGILTTRLSDHQAYSVSLPIPKSKKNIFLSTSFCQIKSFD